MKRLLLLTLTLIFCLTLFAGCGGGKESENPGSGGEAMDKGTVFDAGEVCVSVPDGWKAFNVYDMFAEDPNTIKPTDVRVIKGGESDADILTNPYVEIVYYGPSKDLVPPTKDFYDEATDIEPFTAGGYTWEGFTALSFDTPLALLWTSDGDIQYQANIWLEASDGKIELDDADLIAILASVKPSK